MSEEYFTSDTLTWDERSWIIGVMVDKIAIAYPWKNLINNRIIQDNVNNKNIILTVGLDDISFYAMQRNIKGRELTFIADSSNTFLLDSASNTKWTFQGECIEGQWKGEWLPLINAYNEYWHSWKSFHPNTLQAKE